MSDLLADTYLRDVRSRFALQRQLAERAASQVMNDDFFATLDGDANSVGLLMKHVGGNLRSRWTDVLSTDGEKPDRDRDGEFERRPTDTRATITDSWARGWSVLESTLQVLTPGDLLRTVLIRGEAMPLVEAISRSLAHTAQHVGQIILLARHFAGPTWVTLSIPRGQSERYRRSPRPEARG